jgi:nucleoside-diphosphate-sugar epimerase
MTKVIVFGSTGAIGTNLVEILSAEHADWEILTVTRSVKGTSRLASMNLPNVTMVEGDPLDKESVLKLTADCDIVYSCIGLPYERKYWAKNWPIVIENLLAAIKQDSTNGSMQKKRLVFCDNLYAYGPGENRSRTSSTIAPSDKSKPAVRAKLREMMVQHMTEYPGTVTSVGGADFFGPHVTTNGFLGDTVTGKIVQGQSALGIGSVSVVHDFCFAPDFARALAVVSANDENFLKAADKFLICPHTIHNKTIQEIANDIAVKVAAADTTTTTTTKPVSFSVLSKWMLILLSPFVGFLGEILEMLPFWTAPYTVDDSEFASTFGVQATPYDSALQSLVDFYLQKQS